MDLTATPFAIFGVYFSSGNIWQANVNSKFRWLYLRFWQKQGDVSGDASESFSFASFFPGLLRFATSNNAFMFRYIVAWCCPPRPFVTTATAPLSQVFRICGCYHGKQQPNRASTPAYLETPVSLADPADAERRRLEILLLSSVLRIYLLSFVDNVRFKLWTREWSSLKPLHPLKYLRVKAHTVKLTLSQKWSRQKCSDIAVVSSEQTYT